MALVLLFDGLGIVTPLKFEGKSKGVADVGHRSRLKRKPRVLFSQVIQLINS